MCNNADSRSNSFLSTKAMKKLNPNADNLNESFASWSFLTGKFSLIVAKFMCEFADFSFAVGKLDFVLEKFIFAIVKSSSVAVNFISVHAKLNYFFCWLQFNFWASSV